MSEREIDPEVSAAAAAMGRKGGQRTAERHGPEFYREIGKKGGQRVRELIKLGQANEEPRK